jgi:hypothetical protein
MELARVIESKYEAIGKIINRNKLSHADTKSQIMFPFLCIPTTRNSIVSSQLR